MPHIKKQTLTVEVDASGDATVYSNPINGFITSIRYVKNDYANGVEFDVTLEDSGQVLWDEDDVNASKVVRPVVAAQTNDGADSTLTELPIAVADERVKIVVSSGGNATSGTFIIEHTGA